MTYRIDPKRKAAAAWHAWLDRGMHWLARCPRTGQVIAYGRTQNAPTIKAAMRHRRDLELIHVDDQI